MLTYFMKISVVLAAYNEEKLIGKCLNAILNQSYPREDYEILVIDNASTDNTAKIAMEMGVKVIPYTDKRGAIWAKHYAVTKARGEIVAVTDADSMPSKNWIYEIEKLMQNEKIVLIGGKVLPIGNNFVSRLLLELFDVVAKILQVVGIPLVWGSNMAVRKEAFDAVGGFNTKLQTSDDWEFTMRIQKKFGLKSVKYTDKLRVLVSPRKFESFGNFIPYFINGLFSFILIFIFRKSRTFGTFASVR